MIRLSAGDYVVDVEPERGGAIVRFDWCGEPLMRRAAGPSILDVSCFPLVPFSNRIAAGRFIADGRLVELAPNVPDLDPINPIHGFGWLSSWRIVSADQGRATLEHLGGGDGWPWPYRAEQTVVLDAAGLRMTLAVTNLGAASMPCGLGFHPYFPCSARTRYVALHRGEWRNDAGCLPVTLVERDRAIDWWEGRPVSGRVVDTVYTGREGALLIDWPERGCALVMRPDPALSYTVVYTPAAESFFCVEPVTHMTDAFNRPDERSGTRLAPRERMAVTLALGAVRAGTTASLPAK